MTRSYDLATRLSGMAAFVCVVLAVLAHPGIGRADPPTPCQEMCSNSYNYTVCVEKCQNGVFCSGGPCDNGCSTSFSKGCTDPCDKSGPKATCDHCKCNTFGLSGCTCAF
jgi:hypothetical protein